MSDDHDAEISSAAPGPDGSSDRFRTLDDSIEEVNRALSMAELKARLEREQQAAADGVPTPELPKQARPGPRDDELLDELPATDHHLGRFAGWRAARTSRWIVSIVLATVVIVGVVLLIKQHRESRYARLHPLPEVEATITPGTPREMTYAEGKFRVLLSSEAPAVNLVHLPDRDITLARGVEKASFKFEIREGKTIKLEVLTGEIVETLTAPDAEPLLD
ncbi:MAG: hypothetical protein R6X02_13955 [Enhygromyxa sp.]